MLVHAWKENIMECETLLAAVAERYGEILGDNLAGIYVHGSIAIGCFHWESSDIDFLAVVENPVPQRAKLQILEALEQLRAQAPPKGFEMSVALARYCRDFVYPTPYELHFSANWLGRYLESPLLLANDDVKLDSDLAAPFTVIKKRGIAVRQADIRDFRRCPRVGLS